MQADTRIVESAGGSFKETIWVTARGAREAPRLGRVSCKALNDVGGERKKTRKLSRGWESEKTAPAHIVGTFILFLGENGELVDVNHRATAKLEESDP